MPLTDQDAARPLDDVPLGGRVETAPRSDSPLGGPAPLGDVALPGAASTGSLPKAAIAGLVAAGISAAIWAGITIATNYQIGWIAIGVGFLCGVAVRAVGKGRTVPFRVLGAACALIGIVVGNAYTIVHYAAKDGYAIGIIEAIPYVVQDTNPISWLFYAIGVWQGWKVAVANDA